MIIRIAVPVMFSLALFIFGWSAVLAQEAESNTDAEASAEVSVRAEKPRPLQLFKDVRENLLGERKEAKEEMKNRRDAEKETRVDIRADIKAETDAEVRKEMRGEEKERRSDVREYMKEKREEARAGIKARVHNLLRAHLGAIINRLSVSLRYFDGMVERIESRIEKLNERGIDTASLEVDLRTAVGLIATAKVDVQAISNIVERASDESDPEALKAELRAAINKATASVKAAHRALVAVAHDLVALVRASASARVEVDGDVNVDTEN